MSELQQKIDTILSKRKVNVDNILNQMKVINDLKSLIFDIKRKLKESNLDNAELYIPRLEGADKKLAEALQKLEHLKNRFDRETINIGVSGVSHAGKSTLLQAITDLSNNEIPKAEEGDNYADPTTAVRSQIYNGEKHAIVKFRSDADFIKMVNEYLAQIKSVPEITTLSDFEQLNLEDIDYSTFVGNEKYNYERVKSIKEAFKYFRQYLGGVPVTITDFQELKKYVAYNYSNVSERLYPAVMEVEIYCEFPSLAKSIKLGLIDLPGFGENSNVDKIMTDGLENDVDHAVLIIRPNQQDAGIRQRELDSFSRIGEVQKGISKRSNFLSFLINKDERENGLESLVNSTMQDINKYFNNGGENFKTFAFPVITNGASNNAEVDKMLNSILENLISVLPTIDNELIETYKKTLDISDVRALLDEILRDVTQITNASSEHLHFDHLTKNFKIQLKSKLMDLYDLDKSKYSCANANKIDDKDLKKQVDCIYERVKEHIKGDLWVVKQVTFMGFDTWEDYARHANRGARGAYLPSEGHRIWDCIIKEYEQLDDTIFSKRLNELKEDIVNVFKQLTGNLVTKDGQEAADELVAVLEYNGFKKEDPMVNSFRYLQGLKIDFRQNVYPFFYKDGINEILSDVLTKIDINSDKKENITNDREQLEMLALETNTSIRKAILEHDFLDYFTYCSAMTFTERIILSNADSDDYKKLCTTFCYQMFPAEFGKDSNRAALEALTKQINLANELIKQIEKI